MSNNWCYRYIGAASDRFICYMEGSDALNQYPDFRDRHARADQLINELLGSDPCLFYVRRHGGARQPEYEIIELTIATDNDDFSVPKKLESRRKILQFWTTIRQDGSGCLEINRINFVDKYRGERNAFSTPFLIHLLPHVPSNLGIPTEAWEHIVTMPICSDYVPTKKQVNAWGQYLKIERRTAEKRQFCIPFVKHNYPASNKRITFQINSDLATSNGSLSLTKEEFWQRAGAARNGSVKLFTSSDLISDKKCGQELGEIEVIESTKNKIKIKIDPNIAESLNDGDLELPETGFLFFEDIGSLVQIRWQEKALSNLQEGQTHNPFLGEFFFDAAKARALSEISIISQADLLLPEANASQINAVEAVLNAEDLILIQGPPGTGKTTVIAEICYQVASRGGRTLVVSQANLAVDNALSRLTHHPVLRPLREGDTRAKVGREGEPFLTHNVIERWLEKTIDDCQKRLSKQQEIFLGLRPLLTHLIRFQDYLETEINFPEQERILRSRKTELEEVCNEKNNLLNKIDQQCQQVGNLIAYLNSLIKSNAVFHSEKLTKLDSLNKKKAELRTALSEISDYENVANQNIFKVLQESLNRRILIDDKSLYFPPQIIAFFDKNRFQYSPLKDILNTLFMEMNQLISTWKSWDEFCTINNEIYWLIFKHQNYIDSHHPRERDINRLYEKLKNKNITDGRKILNFLLKTIQSIYDSDAPKNLYDKALILAAIKRWNREITAPPKPVDAELILSDIVARFVVNLKIKTQQILEEINCENDIQMIEIQTEIDNLDQIQNQFSELDKIKNYLTENFNGLQNDRDEINNEMVELNNEISECNESIRILNKNLTEQRTWWKNIWDNIPDSLKPEIDTERIFLTDSLTNVQQYFEPWGEYLTQAESYLERYEDTMTQWIERLRNPSNDDLATIEKQYLDNVNVVGITCMKAAQWSFSQRFSQFDVVIVDEVSKSTPPELLIPALKGKKIVMIGDYRQLPPILTEENLDELAEELAVPRERVEFLEKSWFQQQFEMAKNADKGITQKLNIQYRMHPQIMEAINQFYDEGDGGLSCGLPDPDNQRAHHLDCQLIREDQHIGWVKIPASANFREQRIGTSYQNEKEVICIQKICENINKIWADKVANGQPKKEIGIITFYGAQLRLIDERISGGDTYLNLDIRTGTVDRFQGMEKPVIIVSMVRNNQQGRVGFAKTPERVNVAFSRAKELLIIVGCHDLFTQVQIYQEVAKVVHKYQGFIDVSTLL
ncbi:DEAD/DEAH box helicase [Arthrospira platensis]|uniref:Translation initiation factor IF-2 domain-containing protein n=1 Tax=Limnospira platensis NIES-46 TaxID=1236695 RepID=A0A5M3T4S2_LIMPL|nr:AAA domain-containing protein [Arthrospira platensis]MBD2668349.1 AAA family ATPase [Arthrospira platensis FACHB-439]MBD2710015.1 AAA family ATPase [Arthrospira platensis FACHB-835]MDF2209284.1 AAA domain-containing protein [Arthrospira platensis NCB002]MDT9184967.1 AAA domain-containing protein [Limnospira sp. PMC 289.06]MDT9297136.1 AAA domain-containing protein [Arthrospira platensis PCC 7345]MDT9312673.1 AAA domain-containing protein [Limnospira sp. Paracas R14]BDT12330.1 hypothetical